ncbi:collagenase and related proteases [Pelotomaculum thermopropionicum SI]|uniref:Collagenase and related proteases n=1 Tax=Pelotomaculum thermopropionicum (strain DSM 13744 / JCM 10971 / SI) TaxID=370438 RepID=A5D3C7_PELTS|nr:collagenase and related proteases [Pelotomaculum thermopropionicum SI]
MKPDSFSKGAGPPGKKPELLAPAGDLEKLKVAVLYGADAVYLGGRHFSLRAQAANFSEEEMAEGVRFAHARGARVYVAVNVFAHNKDLARLPEYIQSVYAAGADGVIVSDPGVLDLVRRHCPGLPVHLSTQANTTNWASARFWEQMGVSRIVLARELSLEEIREIRSKVGVELEVFIHGAMCISYSGRCLLSSYLAGRDANRGDCAQSCRWRYSLVEEKRPGEYLPVEEDGRGTYILSSRDLCLIEYIPQLAGAGIDSFKIEGRMKSVNYVAGVVKAYRQAIDAYFKDPANYRFNPAWLDEIGKVSNREFTTGFLFGKPGGTGQHCGSDIYRRSYSFVGIVRGYERDTGLAVVEQRNRFAVGDEVEIVTPQGGPLILRIKAIYDEEGNPLEAAPHPRQIVKIPFGENLPDYSILRKPMENGY